MSRRFSRDNVSVSAAVAQRSSAAGCKPGVRRLLRLPWVLPKGPFRGRVIGVRTSIADRMKNQPVEENLHDRKEFSELIGISPKQFGSWWGSFDSCTNARVVATPILGGLHHEYRLAQKQRDMSSSGTHHSCGAQVSCSSRAIRCRSSSWS